MRIVKGNTVEPVIPVNRVGVHHTILFYDGCDWYILQAEEYDGSLYEARCLTEEYTIGNSYEGLYPFEHWIKNEDWDEMHAFDTMKEAVKFLSERL